MKKDKYPEFKPTILSYLTYLINAQYFTRVNVSNQRRRREESKQSLSIDSINPHSFNQTTKIKN
tara:strand:- start:130 stop:321 length:192 start_codon:yes stop_codon:yes gene_type:complete